ncbi:unnamed protein product [Tenebrio molitor]|nr:unnamed protein product [Tenebrio molitor]
MIKGRSHNKNDKLFDKHGNDFEFFYLGLFHSQYEEELGSVSITILISITCLCDIYVVLCRRNWSQIRCLSFFII